MREGSSRWGLFGLLLGHAALATAVVLMWTQSGATPSSDLFWDDGSRLEIQSLIEQRYVDAVDPARAEELFHAALNGYVHELDPFSRYFSPAERRLLDEDTRGSFGGIGVHITNVSDGLLVTSVRVGGPADVAGIEPGEILVAADGVSFAGKDQSDLIAMIKGAPETTVRIGVLGADGGSRDVAVKRGIVPFDTVPAVRRFEGDPDVLYLRLSQFSETTPAEVATALTGCVEDGAEDGVGAVVLDLRRNLGGVVTAAVEVAGYFLPPDTLVCVTRGRDELQEYRTRATDGIDARDLPLVVLVDEESASASELLAGAFQDHGRGTLVGANTYGKFLVQTIIPLRENDGAVRFTTSRYETPRGRSAQRHLEAGVRGGLVPEIRVPLPSRDAEEELSRFFAQQLGQGWRGLPDRAPDPDWVDVQLQAALDLVRGAPRRSEPVPARVP